MNTVMTSEDLVTCYCCGGLCPEHKILHQSNDNEKAEIVEGCWRCCAIDCNACNQSGLVPKEKSKNEMENALKRLEQHRDAMSKKMWNIESKLQKL